MNLGLVRTSAVVVWQQDVKQAVGLVAVRPIVWLTMGLNEEQVVVGPSVVWPAAVEKLPAAVARRSVRPDDTW